VFGPQFWPGAERLFGLLAASGAQKRILLIDPDEAFGRVLQKVLGETYLLQRVSTVSEGIARIQVNEAPLVLLNLDLNSNSISDAPFSLLREASEQVELPAVIAYSWDMRRETAVEALQRGAVDFLPQPLDVHALKFALDGAYRRSTLARDLAAAQKFLTSTRVEGLLGNSKAMEQVNEIIGKVAPFHTSVLITGESGTGKSLVARAIHRLSQRANNPFVAFSACAFPESLIEDELFGHEKGAFSGAIQSRRVRFEGA